MLILMSLNSTGTSPDDKELCLLCSSGVKSEIVFFFSTDPFLSICPDIKASDSANDVFPLPKCPNRTTFFIAFALYSFILN